MQTRAQASGPPGRSPCSGSGNRRWVRWPAADRVAAWWQDHQGTYQPGRRYLAGQPIAPDHCRGLLRSGCRRERQAAALELALMDPAVMLYETRSPGYRQGGS